MSVSMKDVVRKIVISSVILFVIFVMLFFIKVYNFVLFHSISEMISIFSSLVISVVVLATFFNVEKNYFIKSLAIGLIFVSAIDTIHMMSYEGVNVFTGFDNNLPAQLWILGRLFFAVTLLVSVLLENYKKKANFLLEFFAFLVLFIISLYSIFVTRDFPKMYIVGEGLTSIKIVLEYIIVILLIISCLVFVFSINTYKISSKINIIIFVVFSIISELFFTRFELLTDNLNFMGHIFKVFASVYFLLFFVDAFLKDKFRIADTLYIDTIEYAKLDMLTGFGNRVQMISDMKNITESSELYTVLVCDINNLRLINESYGFESGDEYILKVSRVIHKFCTSEDYLYRVDGDTFIVILKNDFKDLVSLIDRIDTEMATITVNEVNLTISYGYSSQRNNENINKTLQRSLEQLETNKVYDQTTKTYDNINIIKSSLFNKDPETQIHSEKVSNIVDEFVKFLPLTSEQRKSIFTIAQLHDIGKIGISENILQKQGTLTDLEYSEVKRHSIIGSRLLENVNSLKMASQVVRHHHEKWDGTGYPDGLKAKKIPYFSRIISICDACDAIISDRPYRKGRSFKDAVSEISRFSGKQFDPELVEIFERNSVDIYNNLKLNRLFDGTTY